MFQKFEVSPFSPADLVLTIQENYHEALMAMALGLCRRYRHDDSLADDLVQDLYFTILSKSEQVLQGLQTSGIRYLTTSLRNRLYDYRRKLESIRRVQGMFMHRAPESGSLYYLCSDLYIEQIRVQLHEALPEAEYATMVLYFEGYTYKEISEHLQLPVTTINMQIHRAKKVLRRYGIDPTAAHTDLY